MCLKTTVSIELSPDRRLEIMTGLSEAGSFIADEPLERIRLTQEESLLLNQRMQSNESVVLPRLGIRLNCSENLFRNKIWKCDDFPKLKDRFVELFGSIKPVAQQESSNFSVQSAFEQNFAQSHKKDPDGVTGRRTRKSRSNVAFARS